MSLSVAEKTKQYVLGTYARAPFVLDHGEGMVIYDEAGNRYLDFASGISVNALGQCDADITAVAQAQMSKLGHTSNLYYSAPQADLAEVLCQTSFADKVYLANSGTEAVEAAIKFARKVAYTRYGPGQKTGIVAFTGAFHGRTMGSLAMTPREKYQKAFRPLLPDVAIAPFNDVDAIAEFVTDATCAVFVEPVQGEGGINPASTEFLQTLRETCDRVGALLVFDEIQCGMGRTGTLWAYEQIGVVPDMLTAAKALGSGLPIGAVLMTDAVAGVMGVGDHGSTFAGGPVICRVAEATVKRISDPAMLAHVQEMGELLVERLKELNSPHVVEVRGRGLMVGVEFDMDVTPLIQAGYQHGLILINAGPNVLRLLPPLVVEPEHIDALIDGLTAILAELSEGTAA
jgi:predicted acetylornithine/succinylornithine family transaminase